jgi:hypothetical protein
MTAPRLPLPTAALIAAALSTVACAGNTTQAPPQDKAGNTGSRVGGSGHSNLYVYRRGVFNWQGDYSWGVRVDYRDKSGEPAEGPYDIAVTGIGGFQPYAFHYDFDPGPYKYLVFSLKPTIADQQWDSAFYATGDVRTGALLNVLKYGPPPAVGQWTTYKIPLGAGGYEIPAGARIYKFMIQDQTADQTGSNYKSNRWYVNDIYFTAE